MFKVQQNRYLWVHIVGLAAVPLLLGICLAGLASAGPALPFKLQFWTVALIGIVPSAWMQIQRPFYIYALPPLAVKSSLLSEDDRRCLTVLTSWQIKALAGVTASFLLWLLVRLYNRLPQISPVMEPRAGLVSAIAAFFFACLFLQISVSVVRSLLIGQDTLQRVKPFETNKISSSFLILGLRVNKVLPTVSTAPDISVANQPKQSRNKDWSPIEQTPIESTATESETDNLVIEEDDSTAVTVEKKTDKTAIPNNNSESIEAIESLDSAPVESEKTDMAEAVETVLEEPPLVIPEIIESSNSEPNSNR